MRTKNKIYRKAVCQRWLIIYRIKAKGVVIIGILYAARGASMVRGLRRIKIIRNLLEKENPEKGLCAIRGLFSQLGK